MMEEQFFNFREIKPYSKAIKLNLNSLLVGSDAHLVLLQAAIQKESVYFNLICSVRIYGMCEK